MDLFNNLELNKARVRERFSDCGDLVGRDIVVGKGEGVAVWLCYIDMLTSKDYIDENIVSKLIFSLKDIEMPQPSDLDIIFNNGVSSSDIKPETDFEKIITAVLSGDTALFVDGCDSAFIVSTKGFANRGIPKAETEVTVQGSKEAFSEVFRFNTMLIRRRIRDSRLKIKQQTIGRRSKTDIALVYLDDVVRPQILKETEKRLSRIDIDSILDVGMIEQLIEDDSNSPFPQMQITERPDKAASAILEGRIAIVVDTTPFVLLVPATLNVFFQTSEDYYGRSGIMSFVRLLRFFAALIAIAAPGLYLAVTVFHPSMIPTMLAFKFAAARQNIPFPAIVELLLMEAAFELLREAGIRLPNAVGATIGIVGGLIIGQSAVEAGIVSPIVVIVVALTGIAGFAVPNYPFVSGIRYMKYTITLASAFLGFFGFWAAVILILTHLASLKSFGIPYLFPFAAGEINEGSDAKDTMFRMPLRKMLKRPIFANPAAATRMKPVPRVKE